MVATMLFDGGGLRNGDFRGRYPPQVHYSEAHTGLAVSAFLSQNRNRSSSRNGLLDCLREITSAEQVRRGRDLPHHVFPDFRVDHFFG